MLFPNQYTKTPLHRRTFIAIDLLAAIGLTVTLAVLFAAAMRQFAHAHQDADARRVLRIAAENELNRRRAGIDTGSSTNLADPTVELECRDEPGAELWEGFDLLHVTARKRVLGGRWVVVELAGYVQRADASAPTYKVEGGSP